jgi:NAD(P)-dependent dehydrogenase (short-subunit alcohol dehydrogenase family)
MTRTVLITGAAHGIGEATARRFAAASWDVVVSDVDRAAADVAAAGIVASGGEATAAHLDVADTASWAALRMKLEAGRRLPAVIVNNAYNISIAPAHELTEQAWNLQVSVGMSSVYRSITTFHDCLTAQRGSVVNVSSVHALAAWPGRPAYAAAKGGVLSLTRQLSLDYAPAVRINAVIPGAIDTRAWDGIDDAARREQETHISLGRFGRASEVASAIFFLASDDASYITGTSILVDGGLMSTV